MYHLHCLIDVLETWTSGGEQPWLCGYEKHWLSDRLSSLTSVMSAAARASGASWMCLRRAGAFCFMSLAKMPMQVFPFLWSMCVLLTVQLHACMHRWLCRNPGVVGKNRLTEGELCDGMCLALGWVTEGVLGCLWWYAASLPCISLLHPVRVRCCVQTPRGAGRVYKQHGQPTSTEELAGMLLCLTL